MATFQNNIDPNYLISALEWHIDHDASELWGDEPIDRTVMPTPLTKETRTPPRTIEQPSAKKAIMGAAQAIIEAEKLTAQCKNLEELKKAIAEFDGLSIKDTATNLVFSDGNPSSKIMVIGDAPNADDDSEGKAFQGIVGQLLDKIFACIELSRSEENLDKSLYLTNLLNWRPPGNRTPTQAEIDISLPFLQKHIELINPNIIICVGETPAKALLDKKESISKLRGKFYEYNDTPLTVTYHPTYLLQTPAQKRATWSDILMFQEKLNNLS